MRITRQSETSDLSKRDCATCLCSFRTFEYKNRRSFTQQHTAALSIEGTATIGRHSARAAEPNQRQPGKWFNTTSQCKIYPSGTQVLESRAHCVVTSRACRCQRLRGAIESEAFT